MLQVKQEGDWGKLNNIMNMLPDGSVRNQLRGATPINEYLPPQFLANYRKLKISVSGPQTKTMTKTPFSSCMVYTEDKIPDVFQGHVSMSMLHINGLGYPALLASKTNAGGEAMVFGPDGEVMDFPAGTCEWLELFFPIRPFNRNFSANGNTLSYACMTDALVTKRYHARLYTFGVFRKLKECTEKRENAQITYPEYIVKLLRKQGVIIDTDTAALLVEDKAPKSPVMRPQDTEMVTDRSMDVLFESFTIIPPIVGVFKQPLLPLEEICKEPQFQAAFPSISTSMFTAKLFAEQKQQGQKDEYGLTVDEIAAINLLTQNSVYKELNKRLRSGQRDDVSCAFRYLCLLLTGLRKIPTFKGELWLAVNAAMPASYKKGAKLFWWGFSSCTTDIEALRKEMFGRNYNGERTIIRVECDRSVAISQYSSYEKAGEVLLFPGTYLTVEGRLDLGNKLTQINLRQQATPHAMVN